MCKFLKNSIENEKLFNEFQNYVKKNIISFFSKEMCDKFKLYFDELNKWNDMINLVSLRSTRDLIYRHFCDSLYGAKAIINVLAASNNNMPYFKIVDIGSGAGMPGIPIKIVLPKVKVTLVDSITKKCKFLKDVATKLKFDISILNERAEKIGQNLKYRQQYDFVLSRAVSKFSPNLEFAIPLLKINGCFIVYKTKQFFEDLESGILSVDNALQSLRTKFEQAIFYDLPGYKLNYCILVFKKYKSTPIQFPRRQGIPEKNPL
ncbi:MAG: 16S rRNA (guanine(527)-N(7))-methyltransferase RsmG [Endomicrobium sp.]|jgi:16S rRNA (guanine527-N7)-methyltransferase|nr:16S rRNA (guanine(527)-N(7))-methyltransferase RsmG [Endomicrobium sp.]